MILFEAVPGSAFDCCDVKMTADQHLAKILEILDKFLPWEAERCKNVKPTDPNASLIGRVLPIVRKPVLTLPSGKLAMGVGDTAVTHDPLAGQGGNQAIKASKIILERILQNPNKKFDRVWMQETFDQIWRQYSQYSAKFTDLLLAPSPEAMQLIELATKTPRIANMLYNSFNDPATLITTLEDPVKLNAYIKG